MYQIKVEGMSCSGCTNSIAKAVKSLDPAAEVTSDISTQLVQVNSAKDLAILVNSIEEAGFPVLNSEQIS